MRTPRTTARAARRSLAVLLAVAACWCAAPRPAPADTLVLRNGQVLSNVKLLDRMADGTLTINHGGNVLTLPRDRYVLYTPATLFVLTNGQYVSGRLIEETETSLTVDTSDGPLRFSRSEVARIVEPDGRDLSPATVAARATPTPGAAGEEALGRAVNALQAGDAVGAIRAVDEAVAAGLPDGSDAAGLLARALPVLRSRGEQNILAGRFRETQAAFAESLALLGQPRMAVALGGPATQADVVRELDRFHRNIYTDYARRVLAEERRGEYERALQALIVRREVERSFEVALLVAELMVRLDRYDRSSGIEAVLDEARQLRLEAEERAARREGPALPPQTTQEFYRLEALLNAKRDEAGQPRVYLVTTPTPVPTATPTPTPTPVVIATPTPAPTPPPPPPSQLRQYLDQYWEQPMARLNALAYQHVGMSFFAALGLVVGVVVLNWVLPRRFVRGRINRGELDWEGARPAVAWVGLPALLLAFVWRLRPAKVKERAGGARCPHCNARTENIEGYPDLDFGKCPNCGGLITPLFTLEDYVRHLMGILEGSQRGGGGAGAGTLTMGIVEKDAMQKLIRAVVTLGIRRRASDVHIEPAIEGANVRMRIDGVLYDMLMIPRGITNAVVSAIKVMANLDISEHRIPQDGKISMWIDNSDVDIRINTAPHQVAERVTMRLLDSRAIQVESNKLGLEGRNLEIFEQLIRRPSGVVYITGPTGSGKTTTLYVALNTINDGRRNLVTIEDPIEYQLKGINQMQVNTAQGFTFASGLRSILRSDPDVIMIGEVRDKETAEIAVDAASTGHLVFTTLHTIDSISVVPRLLDLGVEPRRVASSMLAAIAQRLIRVNCTACKKPYMPSPAELKQLELPEQKAAEMTFFRGEGCDACTGTGFSGRLGLFEIFHPDETIKEMITNGIPIGQIKDTARRRGLTTIREEAILRIGRGLTTVEEVLRAT